MNILHEGLDSLKKSGLDALKSTLQDQWKDIVTVGKFSEHMVVAPGIHQNQNSGFGANGKGSKHVLSNGSLIRVPENTAACIMSQLALEQVLTEAGEFVYQNGEASLFSGASLGQVVDSAVKRFAFGGQAEVEKYVLFVSLREIQGIPFSTKGTVVYHDAFYQADLGMMAEGTISLRITNPELFIKTCLPPNVKFYSFSDEKNNRQILSEFMQSFLKALGEMSQSHPLSQLASHSAQLVQVMRESLEGVGNWEERFGFKLINIGLDQIAFSPETQALIQQYNQSKLGVQAYEGVSRGTASIAAQQKMADGAREHGLGDGAGMLVGMNLVQETVRSSGDQLNFEQQVEALKTLKSLLDDGILTEEEFSQKKKEIMRL